MLYRWIIICLGCVYLSGCTAAVQIRNVPVSRSDTPTPFQPIPWTPTPLPSPTPTIPAVPEVWVDPAVPDSLNQQVVLPKGWKWAERRDLAEVTIGEGPGETTWVYALVAPFPTIPDEITLDELMRAWHGEHLSEETGSQLVLDQKTLTAFESQWGPPADGAVKVVPGDELIDETWRRSDWAIVPFEAISPRWKIIRIDGHSPLDRGSLEGYPLTIHFRLNGVFEAVQAFLNDQGSLPSTNRDPNLLTTVLMTGTTALVRAVGWKMETHGMDYPAGDILNWLQNADYTHISNESSFNPSCPAANPNQTSLMFCSRPEYFHLLETIGADVIELSGNHNNDWGRSAFDFSLNLYQQHGMKWFAGGSNAEKAQKPLILEHNSNRIAWLGCNLAGPPNAWATADEPGAARCVLDVLEKQVRDLRGEGILPIVTFQYNEIYQFKPSEAQQRDFRRMAAAGAVIVQGSQAHFPQSFELTGNGLIHYGLGNLFFDQMDTPVDGTRREFLDLHVFYAGRYIGSVIYTAMLEDYSRPRPMTPEERAKFLHEVFQASGW
jgi:hypothetical protein